MSLKNEERNKIILERITFNDFYEVKTGKKVIELNGKWIYESDLEQEFPVEVSFADIINIKFDKTVYERFNKYGRVIFTKRGLKNPEEINEKDYSVRQLIEKAKRRNKNAPLSVQQVAALVEEVRREYQPHSMLATYQVLLWAMVYDSMFKIDGKNLEYKFDVKIPASYWGGAKVDKDPLDALIDIENNIVGVFLDPNQPLEVMIAVVTALQNENPELSDVLGDYMKKGIIAVSLLNSDEMYDDAGFLNSRLDEFLQ